MSLTKSDHVWSGCEAAVLEQKIGETIIKILHLEGAEKSCPTKRISKKTRIAIHTVRKWYSARTTPSLTYFLILARTYPSFLRMFLEATGHDYLIQHIRPEKQETKPTTGQCAKPEAFQN